MKALNLSTLVPFTTTPENALLLTPPRPVYPVLTAPARLPHVPQIGIHPLPINGDLLIKSDISSGRPAPVTLSLRPYPLRSKLLQGLPPSLPIVLTLPPNSPRPEKLILLTATLFVRHPLRALADILTLLVPLQLPHKGQKLVAFTLAEATLLIIYRRLPPTRQPITPNVVLGPP